MAANAVISTRKQWSAFCPDLTGTPLHVIPQGVLEWRRAAHHVAFDIATATERAHAALVEVAQDRLEAVFDDAMKLEVLSGRDPEAAIGVQT